MKNQFCLKINNEVPFRISDIPVISETDFRNKVIDRVKSGDRIASFFGKKQGDNNVQLYIILANDIKGIFSILSTIVTETYQSLTIICPQAHMFEREIAEQCGIIPKGHPSLKPVRFRHFTKDGTPNSDYLNYDYYQVEGDEIHEVGVGPVHAGVIEPGHFRFQCSGETVFNLEIALGYQHRGIEKAIIGGPDIKTLHFMETAAGDTTVAHATAYCRIIEALGKIQVTPKAEIIRGIALELERIANHVGDLGALAGDVAYLPTASFCGRLRGDILNMTASVCGNRFGRNLLCPGGVKQDIPYNNAIQLEALFLNRMDEIEEAVNLLWETSSVLSRFERTGKVSSSACSMLGAVGVPARACGQNIDARVNYPSGIFRKQNIEMLKAESGDVYARAIIRWQDIQISKKIITENIKLIRSGDIDLGTNRYELAPEHGVVSIIEGWRGEVFHTALTDKNGKFSIYKIVDPSFHNWPVLAIALRNEQISNFPLCNKSFNLSYCGHDL